MIEISLFADKSGESGAESKYCTPRQHTADRKIHFE